MNPTLVGFLAGAVTLGFFVASAFFLRFWRRTRDRLFLAFGARAMSSRRTPTYFAFSGSS